MQVAFHALPEQARTQSAETAGTVYRQMQDMGRAREENLVRPSQVMQNQAAMENQNPAVRREEARYQGKKSESKNEKRELDREPATVYENLGWGQRMRSVEAQYFDQTA
ncbi:MAG TPA: hypothetical protein DEA96_15480 [Leptospiraceae bacterium]|nr:hypothetical protein [Spirochaetaceae bacterium]HBS06369.1 hypothetical protein [Leptospiraceae bacterium]|tara:strand:+ start:680 stop:1006 length:327 start_codon:yes stop_codon:yes gene_type:complete